jgi:hypothetical protein
VSKEWLNLKVECEELYMRMDVAYLRVLTVWEVFKSEAKAPRLKAECEQLTCFIIGGCCLVPEVVEAKG